MVADTDKEIVGIVGVGRMGLAMLGHMIQHGYQTIACDISDEQLAKAREAGAQTVSSPAEMAKSASFVILGVGYDDEVNDVVLGENGLLDSLAAGSLIAISSTVSPETVKAIDKKAKPKKIEILDAPICRGRWAAHNGTLLALVGGDRGGRRTRAPGLFDVLFGYRPSRRSRPWPGRQGHEQPFALDQQHRAHRGRAIGFNYGDRSSKASRCAADKFGQKPSPGRLGYDELHLGPKRYASRFSYERQSRPYATRDGNG